MTHLHPHRSDDDQIFQKYLDRAIVDINRLSEEISTCDLCSHRQPFTPVLGTGHPLADIFLLKHRPRAAELEEGVAFYGRSGEAILKSVRRLNVDPLDIYGTNCIKCATEPSDCVLQQCPQWLDRELRIVNPKLVVIMGEATLRVANGLGIPDATPLAWSPHEVQQWTPGIEAVTCPDIDDALDGAPQKAAFWDSFRTIGGWYDARPPY